MRLSARVGLDSRETTPLTTGFLIYLKFLSVLKEEKNKKRKQFCSSYSSPLIKCHLAKCLSVHLPPVTTQEVLYEGALDGLNTWSGFLLRRAAKRVVVWDQIHAWVLGRCSSGSVWLNTPVKMLLKIQSQLSVQKVTACVLNLSCINTEIFWLL